MEPSRRSTALPIAAPPVALPLAAALSAFALGWLGPLPYTAGGIRWLIIPAGYVSAALSEAALIALGRSLRASSVALGVIGAFRHFGYGDST